MSDNSLLQMTGHEILEIGASDQVPQAFVHQLILMNNIHIPQHLAPVGGHTLAWREKVWEALE